MVLAISVLALAPLACGPDWDALEPALQSGAAPAYNDAGSADSTDGSSGGPACALDAGCCTSSECQDPNKPVCSGGACRGCLADGDCSGARALCELSSGRCVACFSDADCHSKHTPTCSGGTCI